MFWHLACLALRTEPTAGPCSGALGNGFTEDVPTPQETGMVWHSVHAPAVMAGMWHSGAIVDGVAYMWGKGKGGRLGLGDEAHRSAPEVVDFEAGAAMTLGHCCSLCVVPSMRQQLSARCCTRPCRCCTRRVAATPSISTCS